METEEEKKAVEGFAQHQDELIYVYPFRGTFRVFFDDENSKALEEFLAANKDKFQLSKRYTPCNSE